MIFSKVGVALALPLINIVASASPRSTNSTCSNLNQRKAWTALTDAEKKDYIDAELCLIAAPPQLSIEGALNRFDEVVYAHVVQSNVIHDVGAFLPWHRLYMRAHEKLLQDECGYKGAQPYWDELADVTSGPLSDSSVLDADTGFGTGNVDANYCITDGPFVNLTLHINQTSNYDNSCLKRDLNQDYFNLANSTYLNVCLATLSYDEAMFCFQRSPHAAGHGGIGGIHGTIRNAVASPSDPIFFLHHTYLDRLWWQWQQANPQTRLYDIGIVRNVPPTEFLENDNYEYPGPEYLNYNGDPGMVTTLNHTLWMIGLMDNATIAEVMDSRGELICAEYV